MTWDSVAVVAALLVSTVVFLAALLLLALFVRNAAHGLIALSDLREHTDERAERRATVAAAREAVEDVRAYGGAYGGSTDADLLRAVQTEAAMNGKVFRTADNERANAEEEEEPSVEGDSFFVPASEQ